MEKKSECNQFILSRIFTRPLRVEHTVVFLDLILKAFAWLRDDRSQKDYPPNATPFRHQRKKQPAGRVRHCDRVVPISWY